MPGEKHKSTEFDALKYALAIVFFVFSYGILFAVGSASQQIEPAVASIPILNLILPFPSVWDQPYPIWQVSMMNLLMPVFGFWAIFFLFPWIEEFLGFRHTKKIFPVVFTVFCLGAFFVALYWQISEYARTPVFDFWGELRSSAFYLFIVSGLLGYASRVAVEKINI